MTSLLTVCLLLSCYASGEVFKDGETVCFLGDSITHGGRYYSVMYDYYLTRFPERTIYFVNAGVSGDSAGGAQGRLVDDVICKKPTSVSVMLGMNDVGRGNYVADPDSQKKSAQQNSLDGYKRNMDKLIGRIRTEANPRLILITPSPFDQTAVNDRNNNQPGCNDGLGRCAEAVREMAKKYNGEVVDFHGPMTAFNLEQQKKNPAFTIVGADRVHPGQEGHLMMAWLFLKAQAAPAMVSEVVIDATSGKATKTENAEVNSVEKKDGGWQFKVLEKALPFPVNPAAKSILTQLPIEQDLNREILSVVNLADGKYELLIDGTVAGSYSSGELAKGINLACNESTPQFKQAQAVAQLNEKRRSTETKLRDYAAVRWFLRRHVNPDDMAAVKIFAETKMNKTGYYEGKVADYMKSWEKRGEVIEQVKTLEQQLFALRKPVEHLYLLRRAQ